MWVRRLFHRFIGHKGSTFTIRSSASILNVSPLSSPSSVSRVSPVSLQPRSRLYTSATEEGASMPGKLLLGFTCNVCEKRTHRTISKQAYTKGIVLIECPGCKNRHLIADRLGWFEQRGLSEDIEAIMQSKGETIRKEWRQDEQGAILECLGMEAASVETPKTIE